MNVRDITKLTDYPLIEKLAQALWEQETFGHGVAIMVGAGFSRSGATTYDTHKKLPIWRDLAQKLAVELGESEHTDALRLAQMYQDYFGKQRLYDLLKNAVEDEIWEPTELYEKLLSMPWSEVLTTNWDTLLERASRNIHEPIYDIVSKQEDLASCHSPRIVKLHGTINVSSDLIFTQEDYRCYPQKYGIFVNFVRQVFVENELCLIGFSCDDPNFLQWIGWVRDNLQSNARRIYLVGVLNLSAAKRKYLECYNLALIDLSSLVSDIEDKNQQFVDAYQHFLKILLELQPKFSYEWKKTSLLQNSDILITKNALETEKLIENQISILERNRNNYPKWLICPEDERNSIEIVLNKFYKLNLAKLELKKETLEKILYEIVWMHRVTFTLISKEYMNLLIESIDFNKIDYRIKLNKKRQLELVLYIYKYFSCLPNNLSNSEVCEKSFKILESNIKQWPEIGAELAYFMAIKARDKFEYASINNYIDKISGTDPIWKLRKAYLLTEMAEYEKSSEQIDLVLEELLRCRRNHKNSPYIISRLVWADYMKQVADLFRNKEKTSNFKTNQPVIYNLKSDISNFEYNPFLLILPFEKEISEYVEIQQEKNFKPEFNIGLYINTEHSNHEKLNILNVSQLYIKFDNLCNIVGLPVCWKTQGLINESALKLAKLENLDNWKRLSLVVRGSEDGSAWIIKEIYSRNNIAKIPDDIISDIINSCMSAINYWSQKIKQECNNINKKFIFNRLSIFIEILSRFQIRASIDNAIDSFKLAISLFKMSSEHVCTVNCLNSLILNSMESIPLNQHHLLLLEALESPIKEDNLSFNPIILYPGERSPNIKIENVINHLIEVITNQSISCYSSVVAANRLLPLYEKNFLTKEEKEKFIFGLIKDKDFTLDSFVKLMQNPTLHPNFVLSICPDEEKDNLKRIILEIIFIPIKHKKFINADLEKIIFLSCNYNIHRLFFLNEAAKYFDILINWYDENNYNDSSVFTSDPYYKKQIKLVGEIFYCSLVPALSEAEKNEIRFQNLCNFLFKYQSSAIIIALIPFVLGNPERTNLIKEIIQKNLRSYDEYTVTCAARAILEWGKGLDSDISSIRSLIVKLLNKIELGQLIGIKGVLYVIRQMFNYGWLHDEDVDILIDNLPSIFSNANYANFNDRDREVITISITRAESIKLARDILKQRNEPIPALQNILDKAKNDALPEVRFAEQDEYCK